MLPPRLPPLTLALDLCTLELLADEALGTVLGGVGVSGMPTSRLACVASSFRISAWVRFCGLSVRVDEGGAAGVGAVRQVDVLTGGVVGSVIT